MHSNNYKYPTLINSLEAKSEAINGCVNRNAIIDRAGVSIGSPVVLPTNSDVLSITHNKPSLGKTAFYARFARGMLRPSKNAFHLHYGKASRFAQVPEAQISLFSGVVPLTAAQVYTALRALSANVESCRINYAEFAFDISNVSQQQLAIGAKTRMRQRRSFVDRRGWGTLYLGTRQSDLQVCIYQKTKTVVRIEVVCRREYLKALGVVHPEELIKLASINLKPIVNFELLNLHRIDRLIDTRIRKEWMRRAWRQWMELESPSELVQKYVVNFGVSASSLQIKSPINQQMSSMQKQLIW